MTSAGGGREVVFTVWSDEIFGRIDAFFYRPEFKQFTKELKKVKSIPFGEIIKSITNGFDYREFDDEASTEYLRVSNIKPYEIVYNDVKKVKLEVEKIKKSIQLHKGDILLTRKGTFGVSVALGQDLPALISSEIFLIRLKREDIEPSYVEAFLNSSICQKQFQNQKVGAIMGSLSQESVKQILIPLPPYNIQKEIAKEVQNRREKAKRLKQEAETTIAEAQKQVEEMILV